MSGGLSGGPGRVSSLPKGFRLFRGKSAAFTLAAVLGFFLIPGISVYFGLHFEETAASHAVVLRRGVSRARPIKRGEVQWYDLALAPRTFARIEVDQREIDVALLAAKPDGSVGGAMDSGPFGREVLSVVTAEGGVYRIGVRAVSNSTAAGRYLIRLAELRPLRAEDLKRSSAQTAFAQAQQSATGDSITLYQTAARLWREGNDTWGEAVAVDHLGVAYGRLGRWEDSYQCYLRALHLAEALKDEYGRLEALGQIGRVAGPLGERFSFVPSDLEFLRLWRRLGDRRGVAKALAALSGYFRDQKTDYAAAIAYAKESVALERRLGDTRGEGISLESLVIALVAEGHYEAALEFAFQILRLNRSRGDERGEAASLGRIGQVLFRLQRYDDARHYFEQELRLREMQGDRAAEDRSHEDLARVDLRLNEPFAALPHVRAAMALEESIRQDIATEKWRDGFSGTREMTSVYIRTLRALESRDPGAGYLAEAFLAGDRAHGRLVVDEKENLGRIGLHDVQKELLDQNSVLLEYDLGPVVENRSESFLWVVTPDALLVYELPARSAIEDLVKTAYEALSKPGRPYDEALQRLGHVLLGPVASQLQAKRLLFVSDGLLQYVPFPALADPGRQDAAPLATSHTIEYLPSAVAALALQRRRAKLPQPPHTLAIVADPVFDSDDPRLTLANRTAWDRNPLGQQPDLTSAIRAVGFTHDRIPRLPYSRIEARGALAWAAPSQRTAFFDFSASRDLLLNGTLRDYKIIHFATHGLVNDQDPDLSGLLLSRVDRQGGRVNGFFRLKDLDDLHLPADLVVLSACQTAVGRVIRGEGVISLSTGFLRAGVGAVLATTWKIDDEATAEFMKAFYSELLGPRHRSSADALRAAQLTFSQNSRWHSPYYWAGFVLTGVER
jgi:CHAT domain-containing protein